jgi:hypothetical protein
MDFLIKLLTRLLLLAIFAASGGGYFAWKSKVEPNLAELREKDAVRYFEMVREAKALNFPQAQKLFFELDSMTPTQVAILNYNKFNARWAKDPEFRQEVLIEQETVRKLHKEIMSYVYKGEKEAIGSFENSGTWVLKKWEKMSPWKKGLVLREKCFDYLSQETLKNKERKESLNLTRFEGLQENLGRKQASSELCEKWVPIGQKEEIVEKGLQNLKVKLSYFAYTSILQELGIPEKKVFKFSTQFKRLVGDFIDS